jgi:hypothetical protein
MLRVVDSASVSGQIVVSSVGIVVGGDDSRQGGILPSGR